MDIQDEPRRNPLMLKPKLGKEGIWPYADADIEVNNPKMITSKEELHAEIIEKVYRPMAKAIKEAYKEALEALTNTVGVNNPYHQSEAERAYSKRLLDLPPNLRSLVCAGIELSLAEGVFSRIGRDLTEDEARLVRHTIPITVISIEDLHKIGKSLSDELKLKPTKQTPKGIPWNKSVILKDLNNEPTF